MPNIKFKYKKKKKKKKKECTVQTQKGFPTTTETNRTPNEESRFLLRPKKQIHTYKNKICRSLPKQQYYSCKNSSEVHVRKSQVDLEKKCVSYFLLKDNILVALRISNGKLFHNRGAATANARSPYVVFVRGPRNFLS